MFYKYDALSEYILAYFEKALFCESRFKGS